MSFYKFSYLALIVVVLLSGCEDKQTQKKGNTKTVSKDLIPDSIPDVETIAERRARFEAELPDVEKIEQEQLIPFLTAYGKDNPENRVVIKTDLGDIYVTLFNDTPLHRANFIRLAKLGYFDTTFFHRVSPNFVIQGGNSDRTDTAKMRGKVGSFLIPSEFKAGYSHIRGAFAAAKYSEQNVSKASSPFEFYIVQKKNGAHHIDNDHTVFGRVTKGMDVVDKINAVETDDSEWPLRNIPITIEVLD
ncbi:peptidylprolyl isomerase [Croceibacter atlanticus]|uniref:peptidylprolyl isomerase n=1 Tax=Croceibacter atlanticus TaxID=313588 RepID=UPI0030DA8145|tara:strand:+ start:36735 stop:37472 length:738 start_codon:yes stop_codon:yes gene_type:complete